MTDVLNNYLRVNLSVRGFSRQNAIKLSLILLYFVYYSNPIEIAWLNRIKPKYKVQMTRYAAVASKYLTMVWSSL